MSSVRCMFKFRCLAQAGLKKHLRMTKFVRWASTEERYGKGSNYETDPKERFPDDEYIRTQTDGFTDPETDPMGPALESVEWAFENPEHEGADPRLKELADRAAADANERWASSLQGLPLRGDFGTEEVPVIVPSEMPFRVVGCCGAQKGTPPHDMLWFTVRAGPVHRCPECGQCFQLETLWPGHFEHPKHKEWLEHGGPDHDIRHAAEFTAEGMTGQDH